MKRILSFAMVLCLALSALPAAQAMASGSLGAAARQVQSTGMERFVDFLDRWATTEEPSQTLAPEATFAPGIIPGQETAFTEPQPALFDDGICDITCAAYGNRVDYARIGDWVVRRGYLMEREMYCLIGQAEYGEPVALTDTLPGSFVPAGDAVVYYGKDADGRYNWVIREPNAEKPVRLDLGISDEVFYADEESIWYYTSIGAEKSIRKLSRKSGQREGIARTSGVVLVKMDAGGILAVDFDANELTLVKDSKDGKDSLLYKPEEPIVSVTSGGRSVWVQHDGREFGLLEDGALGFRLPGNIVGMAGSTDQYVFLLSFPGSAEYDVMMFNDLYRAYTHVGYAPASEDAFVELQPDGTIIVWGPEKSLIFDIPPAEAWIPYGFYDVETAQAAAGARPSPSALEPSAQSALELEPEDVTAITIPANLCAFTDEATAIAQAEAEGIEMTVNRDGSYTYFMTPRQQQEQLAKRAQEIQDALDMVVSMEPYCDAVKAYTASDDFSEITLTVVPDQLEDSLATLAIAIIGMVAPTYQAIAGNENPTTAIHLVDQSTGSLLSTLISPNDFSN